MAGVRLEVLRGLSECVGGKGVDSVFFNREIEEDSTVGDVIRKLATEHKTFGDIILNTQTNELSGGIAVVLNDQILPTQKGLDTKIKDGDIIRLFPLIAGG